MLLAILGILGGLILLPLGAEGLVRGAVALAQRLKVPPVVIGLTIVAAGTSMPELVTAVSAALHNAPGLVLGSAIGSNIANLSLVLGVAALLGRIPVKSRVITSDVMLTLGITGVLALLVFEGSISRIDGLVLLGCLIVMNIYILKRKDTLSVEPEPDRAPALHTPLALAFMAGGLTGLVGGAHLLVSGARFIAESLGVGETLIGATVVAIGTSLPELAATLAAARGKHYDIMLGNLLGSCQFNLAAITGLPALVSPLEADQSVVAFHLPALAIITLAAAIFLHTSRAVLRREGLVLVLLYTAYIVLSIYVG